MSVKILDRLDELDYRLHLRRRRGAPRPELSGRKLWFLRVVWSLHLLFTVGAIAAAIAGPPGCPSPRPRGGRLLPGVLRQTRRRIIHWLARRSRRE